jgi:hypothetical protein
MVTFVDGRGAPACCYRFRQASSGEVTDEPAACVSVRQRASKRRRSRASASHRLDVTGAAANVQAATVSGLRHAVFHLWRHDHGEFSYLWNELLTR